MYLYLNFFNYCFFISSRSVKQSWTRIYSYEQDEDNIFSPWSIDEDKVLYTEHKAGLTNDELCAILKRGKNGVKERLKKLNDPRHNAFIRLFGTQANDPSSIAESNVKRLVPCKQVIQRIIWDPSLDSADFSFIYKDRYSNLKL